MSALNTIIKWAQESLPSWQGDAVRRILISESLTKADEDELYLMMLSCFGLIKEPDSVPKPVLPNEASISGAAVDDKKTILKSITIINNVNALPNGNELPLGHDGVTIIYGENASGKSGYARILKRACNARDKRDTVLGNAFSQSCNSTPKAAFKIKIGDQADSVLEWQEGSIVAIPDLSSIAVFDSKCARILIDEKNEFQYKPYGTHAFEDLVELIEVLKKRLLAKKPQLEKPIIANVIQNTTGNDFYTNLETKGTINDLQKYKSFSKDEEEELEKLKGFIDDYKKANIDNKIVSLEKTIKKYVSALKDLRKLEKLCSTKVHAKINQAINSLKAAQEAQKIAQSALNDNDFPLKGVRTDAWRQLFEAAAKFSSISAYPNEEYPIIRDGARCVLCMQNLDNSAKERLKLLGSFIKDEIGTNLINCTNKLTTIQKAINSYRIRTTEENANYVTELAAYNNSIAEAFINSYSQCRSMQGKIQNALTDYIQIPISTYIRFQTLPLFFWLHYLKQDIVELEKAKVPELLDQKSQAFNEITTKKAIFDQFENIQKYLKNKQLSELIQKCADSLDTRSISSKGREVINQECTPSLQKYLREELDFLSAHRLNIRFKPRGLKGVMLHEVEIAGSFINELPSKILSEGEQKAVAIAGFFAELKLSNHKCPIIFDDPVTSLDHKYRDKIAERIAIESHQRQTIVFTHDISFLIDIEKHLCRQEASKLTVITLARSGNQPGHVFQSVPWHAMAVKDRLTYLENELNTFKSLYASDQAKYNEKAAEWFGLFRETIEAIIEEVVFNNSIRRFGAEIQTLRVCEVEIVDDDYKTIDLYMSKTSEWMHGHDKSKALSVDRPSPDELQEDLRKIREFVKVIKSRRAITKERRNNLLKPQPAQIG
jgi:energy-coupling factor transporter ATP-binding protein EcfA2